jgi:hypothetical protein
MRAHFLFCPFCAFGMSYSLQDLKDFDISTSLTPHSITLPKLSIKRCHSDAFEVDNDCAGDDDVDDGPEQSEFLDENDVDESEQGSSSGSSNATAFSSTNARFAPLLTEDEINFKRFAVPKNTERNNVWSFRILIDWIDSVGFREKTPANCWEWSDDFFDKLMSNFIPTCRNKKGKPYTDQSVYQITCAIFRHVNRFRAQHGLAEFNDFRKTLPFKSGFYKVLDSTMKELKSAGHVGQDASTGFTSAELSKAFSSLNLNTSRGLSDAVFLVNGVCFALRGMQEHYDLQTSCFSFGFDSKVGKNFIQYDERKSKSYLGGVKKKGKMREPVRLYENGPNMPDPYQVFMTYWRARPHDGDVPTAFYLTPNHRSCEIGHHFSKGRIGVNKISSNLKRIFGDAGIDTTNLTNHSARKATVQFMEDAGFQEDDIMRRTGHQSKEALRHYAGTASKIQHSHSEALVSGFQANKVIGDIVKSENDSSGFQASNEIADIVKTETASSITSSPFSMNDRSVSLSNSSGSSSLSSVSNLSANVDLSEKINSMSSLFVNSNINTVNINFFK